MSWRKIYSSRSKIRSKIQDDPSTVLLTIYRDHAKLERHLTFKIRKPLVGTRRCNRVHSVRTRNVCLSIIHLRLYCILHSIFKSAWCKISFFFFFFETNAERFPLHFCINFTLNIQNPTFSIPV